MTPIGHALTGALNPISFFEVFATFANIFALDVAVLLLAGMVLLIDAYDSDSGRALGYVVAGALGAILVSSFFIRFGGEAPYGVYVASDWTMFLKRVFLAAAMLGILGSVEWLEANAPKRHAEYYALILFSTVGMMLLPGARDWIFLVICFELMGIPLYVLAAYAKNDKDPASLAAEAGLKLFITGAASSAITLLGLAMVVGLTGTTELAMPVKAASPLLHTGMLLVLAGFGFKIGAVPFHLWIPDTYQGAPPPFVAFLSVAPKAAGVAALAVVLIGGWTPAAPIWAPVVTGLAVLSMIVGNVFALPQSEVRRLLGFSGVGQIGYVLVALAAQSESAVAMALFFLAAYVFTNIGAFLVLQAAAEASGGFTLSSIRGLSKRSPWLGAALLVFLLSLAGIPFAVGFWAKLFVFLAAYKAGLVGVVITGVVFTIVGLFYYLTVARATFMADTENTAEVTPGVGLKLAIVTCLLAVLGLGLWPSPLVEDAHRAAAAFYRER